MSPQERTILHNTYNLTQFHTIHTITTAHTHINLLLRILNTLTKPHNRIIIHYYLNLHVFAEHLLIKVNFLTALNFALKNIVLTLTNSSVHTRVEIINVKCGQRLCCKNKCLSNCNNVIALNQSSTYVVVSLSLLCFTILING